MPPPVCIKFYIQPPLSLVVIFPYAPPSGFPTFPLQVIIAQSLKSSKALHPLLNVIFEHHSVTIWSSRVFEEIVAPILDEMRWDVAHVRQQRTMILKNKQTNKNTKQNKKRRNESLHVAEVQSAVSFRDLAFVSITVDKKDSKKKEVKGFVVCLWTNLYNNHSFHDTVIVKQKRD